MSALTPTERAVATYRDDWARCQMHRRGIAKVNPEILPSTTSSDFTFRYIDIASVKNGAIDWSAVLSMQFADSPSRARRVVRSGDTLICTVRPLLGSHVHDDWPDDEPVICSTGFAVVRCEAGILPDFLKHLPFCEQVVRQLAAWQCGTNYPAVNERDIRRIVIPLPGVDEQAAIARVLNSADSAIKQSQTAIDRASELHDSVLHSLLERGLSSTQTPDHTYPSGWSIRRVDEVASVESGLTLGKDVSGFKSVELPYLRVANVQDGRLDLTTIKTVRVREDEIESYSLAAGDVLMTEGGDIDKLGRGTIWQGQIENCLHQNHIFRIRANRDLLEPEFLSLVVESDIAKRYFNRVAKRTTNLASINKTQVRAFRFPLPPTTDEQRRVIEVMKNSKNIIAGLLSKHRGLTELKKSLLHGLLTGAIKVKCQAEAATV